MRKEVLFKIYQRDKTVQTRCFLRPRSLLDLLRDYSDRERSDSSSFGRPRIDSSAAREESTWEIPPFEYYRRSTVPKRLLAIAILTRSPPPRSLIPRDNLVTRG